MNLEQSNEASTAYRYNAWVTLYLCVVAGLLWLLTATTAAVAAVQDTWLLMVAGVICIGAILLTRACLSRATIVLSDSGIAALFWGVRTRFVRWHDVKKIIKTRTPIGLGYYTDQFRVYSEDRRIICRYLLNVCGNIAFDENIGEARQLLDQINLQAREHDIPLLVWDLQALAKQHPLRVADAKRKGAKIEIPVPGF
jgi:hypothetical protein